MCWIRCFERCALDIWATHGDALAPAGEDGMLVPRSKPSKSLMGLTDPHVLTPEMLERVGTKIEVTLGKFNAASLAPLVQAVMMAKPAGLMSQEVGIGLIGAVEDIEEEMRRIEEDQLNATPEILAARHLQFYRDAAMRALMEGDQQTAQQMIQTSKYLASQYDLAMMSRLSMVSQATMDAMQMGVNPQQAQMGMGGQPAMQPTPALPAGQPQPNAAPYLSASQFGGTTGQQSPGRPPVNPGY